MGREVRRVPVDFDWPLDKVWDGFLNPHYRQCPDCRAGYSRAYDAVAKHINGLMWDRAVDRDPSVAAITTFLAGRAPRGGFCSHDSIDAYLAVKRLGELAGLPEGWSTCKTCEGSSCDPAFNDAWSNWEKTEPPSGEGWQVWETVSEGSPVSPVFDSRDGLVSWLIGQGYSRLAAESFTDSGWAPSMVMAGGAILNDIESARLFTKHSDEA